MRPGRYLLTATLDDGADPAPVQVEVLLGAPTQVRLVVPDGYRRGRATGRVVDSDSGAALAGARVSYSNGHRNTAYTDKADANGQFAFEFAARSIGVTVTVEGYKQLSVQREVGAGESSVFGDLALHRAPR